MAEFEARSKEFVERISKDWKSFNEYCKAFETEAKEPDLEDLYNVSKNGVESQKKGYVAAIIGIGERNKENRFGTVYEKYAMELESLAYKKDQVLQINSRFKQVLIAYAKYLENLKRSFSVIEKDTKNFELLVQSNKSRFEDYYNLRKKIEKLKEALEEIRRIEAHKSTEASKETRSDAVEDELEKIESKLKNLHKEAETARSYVLYALSPIRRPAKKFDYGNKSEHTISMYLENPLLIDKERKTFEDMLERFDEYLKKSGLETKELNAIEKGIAEINSGAFANTLSKLKLLEEEYKQTEGTAKKLMKQKNEIENRRKEEIEQEMRMEEEKAKKQKKIAEVYELKGSIEADFFKCYGKQIEIEWAKIESNGDSSQRV